jgi:hypothetical protein
LLLLGKVYTRGTGNKRYKEAKAFITGEGLEADFHNYTRV